MRAEPCQAVTAGPHRHGQAVSRKSGAMMGVIVSTAFMDGHVQGIDDDFGNDVRQMHPYE